MPNELNWRFHAIRALPHGLNHPSDGIEPHSDGLYDRQDG